MVEPLTITKKGITFFYRNKDEFDLIYNEIFNHEEYFFKPKTDTPFILDCGSHIGIAIAYFKLRFPQAEIIAFEPDPGNFALLTKMVTANKFTSVKMINSALAANTGTALLYGDFQASDPQTCGHSIMPEWGSTRGKQTCLVETINLRSYIARAVDYLKMDIEGAEQVVIPAIDDKLPMISEMHIEFHSTGIYAHQEMGFIIDRLKEAGFQINTIIKEPQTIFPAHLTWWVREVQPLLAVIHARRSTRDTG